MTIEERNNKLKHFITCLKCEVSGKCCDDNCSAQYDAGNMREIIENLEAISKALEQEPTTRNCFGCKYSKDKHNAGTEECHLCMWENQYTPTTKNNLGVQMTNGEKIQTILDIDKDCTEVYGKNGMMTFSVSQDWWNAEYKEPTTKNDLGVGYISRQEVLDLIADYDLSMGQVVRGIHALPSITPQEPRWIPVSEKYEHHIDHTDCIWYGNDSGCPVTCSQYRDGWNDAMDYIFKNGDGYRPYRRNENG